MNIVEKSWFNAVWFQTTWFSCVLGRDDWLLATFALMAFHYWAVADLRLEVRRVLPCLALGLGVDFALTLLGVFQFDDQLFPIWMVCLWCVFPTALPRAMAFLGESWWRPVSWCRRATELSGRTEVWCGDTSPWRSEYYDSPCAALDDYAAFNGSL